MNTEEYIEKAKQKYGNLYDYSKTEYKNCSTKICVICHKKDENGKEHGEFLITPSEHIHKNRFCGCPKCGKEKITYSLDEIREKNKNLYGEKNEIINRDNLFITFKCKEHGEFTKKLYPYLQGCGCPKCGKEKQINKLSSNKEKFIDKARKVHGDKYDYSKVEYKNNKTKVCIICPKHGEFWMMPNSIVCGQGCPKCGKELTAKKISSNKEEFIDKARKIHGDKYNYSKVEYKNNKTKVCIICPEHGEFWQTPCKHLNGQGCSICKESKLEEEITIFLKSKNINFIKEKNFIWIGKKRYDFFLPEHNIIIECHGEQHFIPIEYFGGESALKLTQESDKIKFEEALKHKIKIIYYIPNINEFLEIVPKFYKEGGVVFSKISNLNYILQLKK